MLILVMIKLIILKLFYIECLICCLQNETYDINFVYMIVPYVFKIKNFLLIVYMILPFVYMIVPFVYINYNLFFLYTDL